MYLISLNLLRNSPSLKSFYIVFHTYHSLKFDDSVLWLVAWCTVDDAGDMELPLWFSVDGDTIVGGVDDSYPELAAGDGCDPCVDSWTCAETVISISFIVVLQPMLSAAKFKTFFIPITDARKMKQMTCKLHFYLTQLCAPKSMKTVIVCVFHLLIFFRTPGIKWDEGKNQLLYNKKTGKLLFYLHMFSEGAGMRVWFVAHFAKIGFVRRVHVHVFLSVAAVCKPSVAALKLTLKWFFTCRRNKQHSLNTFKIGETSSTSRHKICFSCTTHCMRFRFFKIHLKIQSLSFLKFNSINKPICLFQIKILI